MFNSSNSLRVVTLCSGYDSQCMALERLKKYQPDFAFDLVAWSEIDVNAIKAHNACFPQWTERNLGDMTKIDWSKVPDFDLLTYSTPCTDISQSGLQKGIEEGSGTRSSILWYTRNAIIQKRPKYLLMENVKALVSKKFLPFFQKWQSELVKYGYDNYSAVLDASDYGVPQHRERIFMVSIRHDNRDTHYQFPPAMLLKKRLKDMLDNKVDEKYYLSEKKLNYFKKVNADKSHNHKFKPLSANDIAFTVMTAAGNRVDDNFVKIRKRLDIVNPTKNGLCMAIKTEYAKVGWSSMFRDDGFRITGIKETISGPCTCAIRGRYVGEDGKYIQALEQGGNVANCITSFKKNSMVVELSYRIRKLTERECFRLMDVDEKYINAIQKARISKTQQYKMAGNSIVVSCMEHIFRKLFINTENEPNKNGQLSLFM